VTFGDEKKMGVQLDFHPVRGVVGECRRSGGGFFFEEKKNAKFSQVFCTAKTGCFFSPRNPLEKKIFFGEKFFFLRFSLGNSIVHKMLQSRVISLYTSVLRHVSLIVRQCLARRKASIRGR